LIVFEGCNPRVLVTVVCQNENRENSTLKERKMNAIPQLKEKIDQKREIPSTQEILRGRCEGRFAQPHATLLQTTIRAKIEASFPNNSDI
jgi:hypothetical protein